jgi:hypothetical protein
MMRTLSWSRFYRYYILIIFVISITNSLTGHTIRAQNENSLFIVIYEHNPASGIPMQSNVLLEGASYDVVIGFENETGEKGIAYNVTVTVPWDSPYFIGTNPPEITITAPSYEGHPEFIITAEKEGFQSAEKEFIIIKGSLSVTTDKGIVEEDESFQVVVTDQNEISIHDAIVYLDISGQDVDSDTTNIEGIVYLSAPAVDENMDVTITAFKEGFEAGIKSIRVENVQASFLDNVTPIFAAIGILIIAMVFVRFRKKRTKPQITPEDEVTEEIDHFLQSRHEKKDLKPETLPKKPPVEPQIQITTDDRGPYVEEIKIPQRDEPEEPQPPQDSMKEEIKHLGEYEWVKGTRDIKKRIDELTNERDTKKADRWFAGEEDVKTKVDEAVKKKKKHNS